MPSARPRRSAEERRAKREALWWRQRAYPAGELPPGAFRRAADAFAALPRVLATPAPAATDGWKPPLAPPPPAAASWTFLGPAPLDTTIGAYETPNMSPTAGRTSAVAVDPTDPDVIYAGYALGGLWKSVDGGTSWTPLMDDQPSLAVGAVAIDPAAPNTIWVGTGEAAFFAGFAGQGLYRSTDGGQHWAEVGAGTFDGLTISRIALDGGEVWVAAAFGLSGRGDVCTALDYEAPGQGLYHATNGAQFTLVRAGSMVDIEIDRSATPRRLFVSDYKSGGWRSVDGGQTWVAPTGLPASPTAKRIEFALSPADPNVVYAGLGLGQAATLYLSTDAGANFAAVPGAPDYCQTQCYYDNSVLVDPTDPNVVYLGGGICGVWKTSDGLAAAPTFANVSLPGQDCGAGSENWYLGNVHPDIHDLAFAPGQSSVVYAASDGGVARSSDAGDTWERLNDGVGTIQFYGMCLDPVDPDIMYGGSQDNGSMKRRGDELEWRGLISGDGGPCVVDPVDPGHVLISNEGGEVLATNNAFASLPHDVFVADGAWCTPSNPGCGDRTGFIAPLVGDPSRSNVAYIGTYRLWQSTDGGKLQTWTAKSPDLTAGLNSVPCVAPSIPAFDDVLSAIVVAPSDPDTIYTGSEAGIVHVTEDGGASWTNVTAPPLPQRFVTALAVEPLDPRTVYVGFSGFSTSTPAAPGHVFASHDAGASWSLADIGVDVPVDTLAAHPVGQGLVYAGTDLGVMITTDGGASWDVLGDALPNTAVFALGFQRPGARLVAGTHGRSAWAIDFTPGTLSASPAELSFGTVAGGADPEPQAVVALDSEIYGSILGFDADTDAPWASVTPPSAETAGAQGTALAVSVVTAGMAPGAYEAELILTPSSGAPVIVPIHLAIAAIASEEPADDGGCGCRTSPRRDGPALPLVLALGLGLAVVRRSRGRAVGAIAGRASRNGKNPVT